MNDIKDKLEQIIKQQLDTYIDKKQVPSSEVLDTIKAYSVLFNYWLNASPMASNVDL